MGQTCSYILVQSGDGCASLAARCGIAAAEFTQYNPSSTLCSTLVPGEPVCCSSGSLPNFAPQPDPDGTCATHTVVSGDTCSAIASANYITVDDIEQWNAQTWGWEGCGDLQLGPICISTGDPPMPAAVEGTVCGPQVPGTARPSSWSQISSLNPCPLNACCDKWGQCGITPDFCTASQSSTGAPGTSAPGTNGCISNCGTSIVGSGSGGAMRIGYFEAFSADRACLTMDPTDLPSGEYTHVHYAFGSVSSDFHVDLSAYQSQFETFASMTGFKRILSFGGWSFSTNLDTYPIFREGSVVDTLIQYNLDGVDFDWEYPGAPDIPGLPPGSPSDGPNYLTFLQDVRALLPAGKSLSIAAPASYWYLKGFPIAAMSQVVDYIVYMTYDLHGQWDYDNAWTNPGCPTGNCLRSHINLTETEYALAMITKAGVPASKIAVGIAGYGRSFGMVDPGCTGPECLFTGPGSTATEGPCTSTAGYISQAELNALLSGTAGSSGLSRRGVTTWYDSSSDSDMMTYGDGTWVAYMSQATKSSRISRYAGYGFAGTVEWAVDLVQFVAGQDEDTNVLSVAELQSEFTAALALSNYDTSQFADLNFTDLATRLKGFEKCTKTQRQAIYSGWQQSWKIMNLLYKQANAGINFNEASAVEYLGPPALTSGQQAHFKSIFANLATIQPGYIPFPSDWKLAVRCDDPGLVCPCDTTDGITAAYVWQHDTKYGDVSLNFCPPYFTSPTLDSVMRYADPSQYTFEVYADLESYYPNQGRTWYHELMHIDWATLAGAYGDNGHVTDLKLGYRVRNPSNPNNPIAYADAYGAVLVKSLARWGFGTGSYTVRNADSMALYALARYVQDALGDTYPHLPLAGNPPSTVTGRFVVPGYYSVESDGTAELDTSQAWFQDEVWTADGACSGLSDQGGDTGADGGVLTLSADFATQSDFPADYLSSYSSWAGLLPTTTTAAPPPPAPTETWRIAIYSEADCSGNYYSLQGYNADNPQDQCLGLRAGGLPQSSDTGPSCRWFTGGGTVWADCAASPLTQPLSWRVVGGVCTAYGSASCAEDGTEDAYDPAEGCHNYDAGLDDTKIWMAVRCGAQGDIGELVAVPFEYIAPPPPSNGTGTSTGTGGGAAWSNGTTTFSTITKTVDPSLLGTTAIPTMLTVTRSGLPSVGTGS